MGRQQSWSQFQGSCQQMNSTLTSVNTKYKLQAVNKFLDPSGNYTAQFTHNDLQRDENVSIKTVNISKNILFLGDEKKYNFYTKMYF